MTPYTAYPFPEKAVVPGRQGEAKDAVGCWCNSPFAGACCRPPCLSVFFGLSSPPFFFLTILVVCAYMSRPPLGGFFCPPDPGACPRWAGQGSLMGIPSAGINSAHGRTVHGRLPCAPHQPPAAPQLVDKCVRDAPRQPHANRRADCASVQGSLGYGRPITRRTRIPLRARRIRRYLPTRR